MKVVQLTLNNEFILEYDSLGSVSKLGFSYYKVRNALKTGLPTQGYLWKSMKNTQDIYEYNDREYDPKDYYEGRVRQISRRGKTLRFWKNQYTATLELDLPLDGIQRCLEGDIATTGGYGWEKC